ncbi:MAG: peptidase U62 [Acidobacteria bacterium]|nr:peptidase U62 [Acidobacteriota bacterium]
MKSASAVAVLSLLLSVFLTVPQAQAKPPATPQTDVLLTTMERELHRGQAELAKQDPAPYFTSYAVDDDDSLFVIASQGGLLSSNRAHRRTADVSMRIGSPALDNTHDEERRSGLNFGQLPLKDDPDAIARVLWKLTYQQYRQAQQAFTNVKTKSAVRAKDDDDSADFSEEKSSTYSQDTSSAALPQQKVWEDLARRYSGYFRPYPYLQETGAMIIAQRARHYLVSTEGTKVVTEDTIFRVMISAETLADDGMQLMRVETFQFSDPAKAPPEAEVAARAKKMAEDLLALRNAPLAEPYNGPAMLSGRAAAVFFHEVLGHRIEGQRQRGRDEGQTFAKKINEKILPEFLSVVDDPTQRILGSTELSGWYRYDDEGVPAERVEVVKDGILKNFLMGRMPVKNFSHSNGHGRSQPGLMPVGRQGNLIVTSSKTIPDAGLRTRFVEEIKKQNKPYGLYFEDIQGGFTLTSRSLPQSFQVLPVMVWRVYADGRPDELVRGVDIVGTPLTVLTGIVATGQTSSVFNGICGAESGNIPVSAAAPAMLFSEIEVQKRKYGDTRPPILPPPPGASSGKGGAQ